MVSNVILLFLLHFMKKTTDDTSSIIFTREYIFETYTYMPELGWELLYSFRFFNRIKNSDTANNRYLYYSY